MGYETDKPQEDSQFRLLRCCGCHSEDVVYIQVTTGGQPQYRVRCRFCGNILPPRRRVLCSVECEKEDKLRRNRSAAHGKGGPRLCPICGKEVGPDLRKTYCSWECYSKNARQLDAKYREKKRAEKKGNVI